MSSNNDYQGMDWINLKLVADEHYIPIEDQALLNLPKFAQDANELSLFIDMLGLQPALDRRNNG